MRIIKHDAYASTFLSKTIKSLAISSVGSVLLALPGNLMAQPPIQFGFGDVISDEFHLNFETIEAADFDLDGDLDILATSRLDRNPPGLPGSGDLLWMENRIQSDGVFTSPEYLSRGNSYGKAFPYDLDGDDDLDILGTGIEGLFWIENQMLEKHVSFSTPRPLEDEGVGIYGFSDMYGDGKAELLAYSYVSDEILLVDFKFEKESGTLLFEKTVIKKDVVPFAADSIDLNNDGFLDVIYTAKGDERINVYALINPAAEQASGDWSSSYITGNFFTSGYGSKFIIDDIDHDSDDDVILVNFDVYGGIPGTDVYLLRNNGIANSVDFEPIHLVRSLPGETLDSKALVDIDGDMNKELIFSVGTSMTSISLSTPDFGEGLEFQQFSLPCNVERLNPTFATLDVDSDGKDDLLSDSLKWYKSPVAPEETFLICMGNLISIPDTNLNYKVRGSLADLDGDGDEDLISVFGANSIGWFENKISDKGSSFSKLKELYTDPYGVRFNIFFLSDLDGDGNQDLITLTDSRELSWLKNQSSNDGPHFPTKTRITFTESTGEDITTADLNQDGRTDLVVAYPSARQTLYYTNNIGITEESFLESDIEISNGAVHTIESIDLDGDGDTDFVAANEELGEVLWLENNLDNEVEGFSEYIIAEASMRGDSDLRLSDMDNDGDKDIVILLEAPDRLVWFENQTTEQEVMFSEERVIKSDLNNVFGFHLTDLNNDNYPDALLTMYPQRKSPGDSIIYLMNNLETVVPRFEEIGLDLEGINAPAFVLSGDLNLDGDEDIIVASRLDKKIAWYAQTDNSNSFVETNGWESLSPDPFTSPQFSHSSELESLLIDTEDNNLTFGMWDSPLADIESPEDPVLLTANWRLSSSVEDRSEVPTVRLRSSKSDFSRSDLMVISSSGNGRNSPAQNPTAYTQYIPLAENPLEHFFSFEVLNVDPMDAAESRISLDHLYTDYLMLNRLSDGNSLLDHDLNLSNGENLGWSYGYDESGNLPAPQIVSSDNGLLLQGVSSSSSERAYEEPLYFGYWTKQTGIELIDGKLYKIEFTIGSTATEEERMNVPTFRLRANDSTSQIGHVINIDSVNQESQVPVLGEDLTYELWFNCPEDLSGSTLNLSFDYLYVEKDSLDQDNPHIGVILKGVNVTEF